ncbi:MAG: hypothetical protein ACAI34_19890 [Verrucomicrobium sp.]
MTFSIRPAWIAASALLFGGIFLPITLSAAELLAGVGKVDITDRTVDRVNDALFAKALVLKSGDTSAVLITVDAVAIGEIGRIGNGFLGTVRGQLEKELGIPPGAVLVNASHCHGIVRGDTAQLAVEAVKQAWKNLQPVLSGTGSGHEDRISENRRLLMKDGSTVDMRRAYSMPRDEDVASVGPIDPEIGLLRLDRLNGKPLAVLYNFACHPIMNPPSKGNSADYPGYASKVIEDSLGEGSVAFFVQGCGGDINPVRYKEVTQPPEAAPLGMMLGLSVLEAARKIETRADLPLKTSREMLTLPRGKDLEQRMAKIAALQTTLIQSLKTTNINFKTFVPLLIQQKLSPDFPSHYSHSYLHDKGLDRDNLTRLDAENRAQVEAYLSNIQIMEQLTRLNANLALLKKHHAQNLAAGQPTLEVEIAGLRVGDFKMVTFPGELTAQVGLNIKKAAQDLHAFVAGYTNGYIYYAATVEQRTNPGFAQEDCDALVAPEWQALFEKKALEVLGKL